MVFSPLIVTTVAPPETSGIWPLGVVEVPTYTKMVYESTLPDPGVHERVADVLFTGAAKREVGAPGGVVTEGTVTVNIAELEAEPPDVVTETTPVTAPAPTVAVIWVAETTVNDSA